MILQRVRIRHQDRRTAGFRKLGNRGGTRTGDNDMRGGHTVRYIVEKGCELRRHADAYIHLPYHVDIFGTALLHDREPPP